MAYFKLAILSISVSIIGLMHGPVLVSCQIFPPQPRIGPPTFVPPGGSLNVVPVPVPRPVPVEGRRSDVRRTVFLLQDDGLQNGGFDDGFGGGFEMLIPLLFVSALLMSLGIGVTTTAASTTTMTTATTTAATTVAVTTAAAATTASAATTAAVTTVAATTP